MNFNCFIVNMYHECTIPVPVPPKPEMIPGNGGLNHPLLGHTLTI